MKSRMRMSRCGEDWRWRTGKEGRDGSVRLSPWPGPVCPSLTAGNTDDKDNSVSRVVGRRRMDTTSTRLGRGQPHCWYKAARAVSLTTARRHLLLPEKSSPPTAVGLLEYRNTTNLEHTIRRVFLILKEL